MGGTIEYSSEHCTLYRGDALAVLQTLPADSVDAVITDPPYSSGGLTRGDRTLKPNAKYVQTGTVRKWEQFSGDNRDSRGWAYWCALWLGECLRVVKPSGYCLCFADWRQLPSLTDAMQAGGWVWRGLVAWDKSRGARAPHTGYFRHQCEYVAWGTKGVSIPAKWGGPWDGCIKEPVRQSDKYHMTGKPTALLRRLVECVPPDGLILDPFAGSGTTAVAAIEKQRRSIMIEMDAGHCSTCVERVRRAEAELKLPLFETVG